MSAKFIWVRNPTAINGLATTYVSLRGSDTNGDGTAQNPYRSLAKAQTMAAAGSNIMMDDGRWNEEMLNNNNTFYFWGNSQTFWSQQETRQNKRYYNIKFIDFTGDGYGTGTVYYFDCTLINFNCTGHFENCVFIKCRRVNTSQWTNPAGLYYKHCIFCVSNILYNLDRDATVENCIFVNLSGFGPSKFSDVHNNNWVNRAIPVGQESNSINNASTGQTIADYFTYVHPNVLANPATASIDDWLACDFTAKPGSANIGAGTNGGNIGFNQGYPARAINDANDIFAAANGATLRNIAWNATLNGYSLVHKDKVCAGYTVNTITLAADAEAIDDYYNGLFIGITAGDGAGEIHRIVDYDGATRVATIDTSWYSTISTSSIYSISGTIDSATKDFGKVIKVKRNWAFLANMQSWTDPNGSYGMWKEFLTSPLQNNGEWMMRPCSNFRYEYSIDNIEWHSSTELLAGTDSDNKTYNAAYGNASESYVAANAKTTVLRYVRYHIEIGFNIGEDAQ